MKFLLSITMCLPFVVSGCGDTPSERARSEKDRGKLFLDQGRDDTRVEQRKKNNNQNNEANRQEDEIDSSSSPGSALAQHIRTLDDGALKDRINGLALWSDISRLATKSKSSAPDVRMMLTSAQKIPFDELKRLLSELPQSIDKLLERISREQ